ncbi:hypothetical protein SB861_03590 [Paraburkholderia sp. SIMBA_049]
MQAFPTAMLIEQPLIYASLYDLAAVVFGSEGIARLSTNDERDEFDKLRVRHEIAQATKLLIEVAVVFRNLLDGGHWPLDVIHGARVDVRPEIDVGVLEERGRAEVNLGFRSACNKMIHAKRISFGMSTLPDRLNFLDGSVELHGDLHGSEWVAKIRLTDFIRMAVRQL